MRQVHVGDTLSHRMLDLKSRIQLEEIILSRVGIVKVLNGTSADVTDVLRQSLGSLFHFSEDLGVSNSRRAFLKNLLKAALVEQSRPLRATAFPYSSPTI